MDNMTNEQFEAFINLVTEVIDLCDTKEEAIKRIKASVPNGDINKKIEALIPHN